VSMLRKPISKRLVLGISLLVMLIIPGLASSSHLGIGGDQVNAGEDIDDVAKEGCLCHNPSADNTVQIILDDVPYAWNSSESYELKLQIIGGPAVSSSWTAGFSMRVSSGALSGDNLQNWDEDTATLTHTPASADEPERMWIFTWTPPAEGTGVVDFWITGNSVDGDGIPGEGDKWNQLIFALQEGGDKTSALGTRTLFAGDGNVSPPEATETGIDLAHMGAEFRAHVLGLLGFGAVLSVILFAGLMLRYSFSSSYKGRSNQLRLRYKIRRRGDQ